MRPPPRPYYILHGQTIMPCNDLVTWAQWFATTDRHIGQTTVAEGVTVSTVFLGMDHQWDPNGLPLLFETMVFSMHDGPLDGEQERYATYAEAVQGHAAMVARVQESLGIGGLPACPPGSLCEVCLDASAIALQPAPWGGERGVCAACARDTETS